MIRFLFGKNYLFIALCTAISAGLNQQAHADQAAGPRNEILTVSQDGLVPSTITLARSASSLFLLNQTRDSLLTYEVDYGKKLAYCATGEAWMDKDGVLRSVRPIEPLAFRSFCLPQPGTYPIVVRGHSKFPQGLSGSIIVKP